MLTAVFVLLDDLDAQPRVQAAHGQIIGDAAAAHDDGVAHLLLDNAKMLDELGKGYVVGLRSRGLSETTILYKNVLKNIMVTVITLTGISLGSLLGGTVIVETVFTWPGLGSLIMEGISQRDYPVVQAVIVWMASAFMVVNLLTDISYTVFNPKIKDI